MCKLGHERTALDLLALSDKIQCSLHAVQGQEKTRRGVCVGACVEGHDLAFDINHRRTGRAAGCARRRLNVESIEVVVTAAPIVGCAPVESRQGACKDGNLFAGIIPNDANLATYLGAGRIQHQFRRFYEFEAPGVVTIKAEVVHRISVHGLQFDFLIIDKDRFGHDRSGRYHVTVGQDQPLLCIDHKSCRLRGLIPAGVKRPGTINANRHHARRHLAEGFAPCRRTVCLLRDRRRHRKRADHDRQKQGQGTIGNFFHRPGSYPKLSMNPCLTDSGLSKWFCVPGLPILIAPSTAASRPVVSQSAPAINP